MSTFRFETRVVTCAECNAPVSGGDGAGEVTCSYCGTVNQIVARDDRRDRDAAARAPQLSEAQRIERLREQHRGRPEPPKTIMHLFSKGLLAAHAVEESWTAWQTARRELREQSGSAAAASERLYLLTLGLTAHLARQEQHDQERALIESALDLLDDTTYRQVLHGMLARAAVQAGDLEAAEQWLALCTPHSESLQADSAFRVSQARISAGRGDGPGVLRVLGSSALEVPIADEHEDLCSLLRAHAHELADRDEQAVEQLVVRLLDDRQEALDALAGQGAQALCPRTLPRARDYRDLLQRSMVRARGHNFVGGVVALVIVGGIFAGGALGASVNVPLGVTVVVVLFLLPIVWVYLSGRALKRGVRGHAKIVKADLHRAGNSTYTVMQLLVQLPDRPTYLTKFSVRGSRKEWVPGTRIRVVVSRGGKDVQLDPSWY